MWLNCLHDLCVMLYPALKATFVFVHFPEEAVLHFGHEVREGEEERAFPVLLANQLCLLQEAIVEHSQRAR